MKLERARLALEGLSVADAFGEQLLHAGPATRQIALGERTVALPGGTRKWMWTDDTAMAVSIVETLAVHAGIDIDDLAQRYAKRYIAQPARGYGRGAHHVLEHVRWPRLVRQRRRHAGGADRRVLL
jgi:ADP-ribosylglycohydrolase